MRGSRAKVALLTASLAVVSSVQNRIAWGQSLTSLTWNKNGTGAATDGAGTWNLTSTDWNSGGTTNGVWNPADTALFGVGGAGGTVTIASGGITAAGLTFNTVTSAYTIAGTPGLTLSASGTPIIQDNYIGTTTITAPIAGTKGIDINFSGADTLALNNTSTYTGGTTVNGPGSLNFYSDASFGAVPGSAGVNITLTNGASIDYALASGTTTLNANRGIAVGNGSGGAINAYSGRTLTYGGTISNVAGQIGNFSTNSVGLLILTGTSTYSGTTTITAGTIRLGVTNALPTTTTLGFDITNTLYTAGATLDLYGNNQTVAGLTDASTATLGRFITNSNTGTSTLTVAGPGSFGGVIENGGGTKLLALTKSGSGTLTLNGTNTYSGATSITGGTLALGSSGSIANSSTLYVGSGSTFDVSANSSFAVGASQTLTGNGNVNGSVSLGPGTINPGTVGTAGTLTFNNGLTLNGGSLNFDLSGSSNTSGGGINDLLAVTGALSLNATTPVSVSFSGTPAVGTTYTVLTSGSETGSGSFLAQQHGYTISNTTPGVVTITYVGGPAVANQVWNSTSSSSWDVNTSANWFNTDSSTTDNFFNGDNVTFNDSISGVQTAVTLTTSLAPGSLTVNSNTSNYTFTSASSTVGKITGTTGLTKLGTSTLTIATALNDYTGVTNISGGILNVSSLAAINTASSIGKGSAAGSAGDLVLNGGTLQYTGSTSQTTNRLFTIGTNGATIDSSGSSGAVLNFNSSGSIAFAGSGPHILTLKGSAGTNNSVTTANTIAAVIGDGTGSATSVSVQSTGWWALTGTNTFTGGVNVSSGYLVYGADLNFGAVPAVATPNNIILNGGTLNQSFTGTVTLSSNRGIGLGNSGGTIQLYSGKTLVYGGIIADAPGASGGTLVKDSVGTLILSGSSTYSGGTNILAGTIQLAASNALPVTTTLSFVNTTYPGYLDLNGFNQTIGGLSDTASTIAHDITNSNTGTGTLTVAGAGTYSGALQDGGAGKLLALTKSGSGTLTLSGTNNYSGPTNILGGTLALSGNGTIATSQLINVGSGAVLDISGASNPSIGSSQTLIGNGSINGSLNFNAGTINPGTVGTAGTLTFNNDLNLNGGTIQLDLSGASNASGGSVNDLINVTGNLAANTTTPIGVTFSGTPAVGTEYLVVTSGSESGSLSNLVPAGHGYSIDTSIPNEIGIIYTGGSGAANLIWNSTSSSNWDIATSMNWFNTGTSANDRFYNGDLVLFNDSTPGVQTSINLTTALAPGSITVNSNTSNYTFSGTGKITGSTGLLKLGTSTLTMSTTLNDYTGQTNISGGILNVAGLANINTASSIGAGSANGSSGDLVLNGGTLQYTGTSNQSTNRLLSIGTAGGSLDSSGIGILTFNGTGTIGFNGQTGPRTFTLTGSNTNTSIFAPIIGDNGGPTSVLKSGAGTWALGGSNTFTGPVTVTSGTLTINSSDLNLGAVPSSVVPGDIILNGGGIADNVVGTLTLNSNRGIEVGSAGGTINVFYNKNMSYGGVVADLSGSAPGNFIKDGIGMLTLTTSSTYTGSTTINAGTLQLGVNNALPTTTTLAFNDLVYSISDSTLDLAGFLQTVSGISDDSIYTARITSSVAGLAMLSINGGGNFNGVISDGGTGKQVALTKSGTAALTLTGTNNYSGGTTITSGMLICTSGLSEIGTGNLTVNGGGAIFKNTSTGAVFSIIQSGFNGGTWNGTGINSTAAAGDSSHLHAVGMYQPSSATTFESQSLNTSDVAVKYTYYGDANLDGKVDGSDYSLIDNAYENNQTLSNTQLTGWQNGDFNYDGVINGSDYTLIDNAFNSQGTQIAAEVAAPTAQLAGASSVPEPTALGLLGIGSISLLGRRRPRKMTRT